MHKLFSIFLSPLIALLISSMSLQSQQEPYQENNLSFKTYANIYRILLSICWVDVSAVFRVTLGDLSKSERNRQGQMLDQGRKGCFTHISLYSLCILPSTNHIHTYKFICQQLCTFWYFFTSCKEVEGKERMKEKQGEG